MSRYDLWTFEAALGKRGPPKLTDKPRWSELLNWSQLHKQKIPLPVDDFPALAWISTVEGKISTHSIILVIGARCQCITALVRIIGCNIVIDDKRDVWYLDMVHSGTQEFETICATVRDHDHSIFIVDHCDTNIEDAKTLLALSNNVPKAKFIFAASYEQNETELDKLLALVDSNKIINITKASSQTNQSLLRHISRQSIEKYELEAKSDLATLQYRRDVYGVGSRDYIELCNEKSLIGQTPEWRHLYMGAYGAFPRPKKEAQLLGDLNGSIGSLDVRNNGLLLHIVSGDSGSGKSVLARLVIRRLCYQDGLIEFPQLFQTASRIHVLEFPKIEDWDTLKKALKESLQTSVEKTNLIYLLFFDDLFAELEQNEIENLFAILSETAEDSRILLLVTSPSGAFSQEELWRYKIDFKLVDRIETVIRGLDFEDRESLKKQYSVICGGNCKSDLIMLIEKEEHLILIKIALQNDLHYSEYFKKVFSSLSNNDLERYLAVLLLTCTLSQYYVHLPMPLIKRINHKYNYSLPEQIHEYARFGEQGFRLFRVREGLKTKDLTESWIPDTVAPFHDSVSQVIYSTWGDRADVPIFGCKIWELRDKIYNWLDESSETRPLLAQVFRGMLQSKSEIESNLEVFVNYFGPARKGVWVLLNEPAASDRWIKYAKYKRKETRKFQLLWFNALNYTVPKDEICLTKNRLLSFLIKPSSIIDQKDTKWMEHIPDLEEQYFFVIRSAFETLLSFQPIPIDILNNYLVKLKKWVDIYPKSLKSGYSYRYKIILCIANANIGNLKMHPELNISIAEIVKSYFLNIADEYKSYYLLSANLFGNIRWTHSDSKELVEILICYLQNAENWFRPILFEKLLMFTRIGGSPKPSGIELFNLLLEISIAESSATSLTYSWQRFFDHLTSLQKSSPSSYRSTISHIKEKLLSEELGEFPYSAGYPDFIHRFLEHIVYVHHEFKSSEMLTILRPLFELPSEHAEMVWIFRAASRIEWIDLRLFCDQANSDVAKQIRLCWAASLHLPMEKILPDFTTLLIEDRISAPTTICFFLKQYFKTASEYTFPIELIADCRRKIYAWLHEKCEQEEWLQRRAVPVLNLVSSGILFSKSEMRGLEILAKKAIEKGHFAPTIPSDYLDWWLREEASEISKFSVSLVLDAYWDYCLKNSNSKYPDGRYEVYDRHFVNILSKYGLRINEQWWGKAVKLLIESYFTSLRSIHSKRTKWIIVKGRKVLRDVYEYERRGCMDKMMDTIVSVYELHKLNLQGTFSSMVKDTLNQYKDNLWSAYWLTKMEPNFSADFTELFVNCLQTEEAEFSQISVYNIRNNLELWVSAIRNSRSDPLPEIAKIWDWLSKNDLPKTALYLIGPLLLSFGKEARNFSWSKLIIRILHKTSLDFSSKSYLITRYTDWLEHNEEELTTEHLTCLKTIFKWLLCQIPKTNDTQSIMYSSQSLFDAARKYEITLPMPEAEEVFFKVSELCISIDGGAALSKPYFSWLFIRKTGINLVTYLDWIQAHSKSPQTPYILNNLICTLEENSYAPNDLVDLEHVWNTLKIFIDSRLDSDGTTKAVENFNNYLAFLMTLPLDVKRRVTVICEYLYKTCFDMKTHPRIIYLAANAPNFLSELQRTIERPTPIQFMELWQELFKLHRNHDMFMRFTTNIDAFLKSHDTEEKFRQTLLYKANEFPDHGLSSQFVNLILDDVDFIDAYPTYISAISESILIFIETQKSLENVAWAIRRCLNPKYKRLLKVMLPEKQVAYESKLLETLNTYMYKPFSEICLYWLIKYCTRQKHSEQLIKLIGVYLKTAHEIRNTQLTKEGLQFNPESLITSYFQYVNEDFPESTILMKRSAQNMLESIQSNAKSKGIVRCLSQIIDIWGIENITQDMVVRTLKALILEQDVKESKSILRICQRVGNLFGYDTLLSPTISMETACNRLDSDKEVGLVSLRDALMQRI